MNETTMEISKLIPIIAPIFVIQLILMVIALIQCFKAEETRGPKVVWVLVIIFVNLLGPIAFFLFGRRIKA
ncbi:PLD nuclease N-terminal domain-containing protein [Paenibacillus soyae]|uniref:PLD nuclease N-terminal domain-containing protein n=1 Tax=Paenibacillus soyae TaxID=2969249 RepID=A0A9X2SA21_9BACL|nr:PLD nuclease N-terminal domain-containing protein [Paenibacillus soyae]MCR2803332.1 PLD nuclease N-terminal domain-containing protein [Paenibacillus soyae]